MLIADLADRGATDRWPGFLVGATGAGVRAVFAFPVRIGAPSIGVVALSRRRPGPLSRTDLATALSVVDAVTLSLLMVDAVGDVRDVEGLSQLPKRACRAHAPAIGDDRRSQPVPGSYFLSWAFAR